MVSPHTQTSAASLPAPFAIVVMGVSGCGKSTVGDQLARAIGCSFLEGDAVHPVENVAKMASGVPLDDADRLPWLVALAGAAGQMALQNGCVVLSCSALREAYRQILCEHAGVPLLFVHLAVSRQALEQRMQQREGHYMPASLLGSQMAALEPPHDGPSVRNFKNEGDTTALVSSIRAWIDEQAQIIEQPRAD